MKSNKKSENIYLDYASGVSANPSGIHIASVVAKKKLEKARTKVAGVLSARPSEIIFTSGGTEGNNLAIQGATFAQIFSHSALPRVRGGSHMAKKFEQTLPHIITTNIEHSSVLETFKLLEKRKLAQITIVPVEANGIVDPKKLRIALKSNTVLVSVMYANNEIGTVQPIREIAKEIRHFRKKNNTNILFHTDAVQAVNYLDLSVERLGVDMLTLSGAKIEGAGRVGVLYKKTHVELSPIWGGGDQEFGLRPGTENLPAIISFTDALELAQKIKEKESVRLTKLRDYFINKLQHSHILKNVGIIINGDLENRLPNNINITIPNIPSDLLVIELSARGVMVSAKSACKMGDGKDSHVILAIRNQDGLPAKALASAGSLRLSLGRDTTKQDIDFTLKALSQILTKLEKWYN